MQSVPAPPFEPEIIDPLLEDRVAHTSFEEFFEATAHEVTSLLALALLDDQRARTATAEAYALALHRWQDMSPHPHPAGWVCRAGLDHATSGGGSSDVAPSADDDHELFEALTELHQQQRALLAMRHLGAWTDHQIGDALGLTEDVGREVAAILDQLQYRLPDSTEDDIAERLRRFFDQRDRSTKPIGLTEIEQRQARLGRRRRMIFAGMAIAAIVTGVALLATTSSSPDPLQVEVVGRGSFPGESVPVTPTPDTSAPADAAAAGPSLEWKRVYWELDVTEFTAMGDAFVGTDGTDQIEIRPTDGNPSIRISPVPFSTAGADLVVGQNAIAAASGEFLETVDIAVVTEGAPLGESHRYSLPPVEMDESTLGPQVFSFQVVHANGTLVVARIGESTELFAGPVGGALDAVDLGREPGPFFDVAASNGWFVLRDFEREALRSQDGVTWTEPSSGTSGPFELVAGGTSNPIVGSVELADRPFVKASLDGGATWLAVSTPIASSFSLAAVGDVIASSGLASQQAPLFEQPRDFVLTVTDSGHTLRLDVTNDSSGSYQVIDDETGLVVLDGPEDGDEGVRLNGAGNSVTFFDPATGETLMEVSQETLSREYLRISGVLEGRPMTVAVGSVPTGADGPEWDVAPITQVFGRNALFVDFVAGNDALLAIVTTTGDPEFYVASIGRVD